jgi:hypothetical protein
MRVSTAQGPSSSAGAGNSHGRAVVYMAESISLAVLENLVHMTRQDFPRGYVCVAAVLPDGISLIQEKDLRRDPTLEGLTNYSTVGRLVARFPNECRPAGPVFCDRWGT